MKASLAEFERFLTKKPDGPKAKALERSAVAHIIVTGKKSWGGPPEYVEHIHHNCSLFEADLEVKKKLRKAGLE